jgi:hypothetical protein
VLIAVIAAFSVDLARVAPSGPPMKLSVNFSVSSMSQPVIHQTNPAENQCRHTFIIAMTIS